MKLNAVTSKLRQDNWPSWMAAGMLMVIAALGSTSTAVQETARTVDTAAVRTLHSSRVARKTEPPPPPRSPLPSPVALTAAGELMAAVSDPAPGGLLAGDRGPALDKLAPPPDDTELWPLPLPLPQLVYNDVIVNMKTDHVNPFTADPVEALHF